MVFEAVDVMVVMKEHTMAEAEVEAVVAVVNGVEGVMLEGTSHLA